MKTILWGLALFSLLGCSQQQASTYSSTSDAALEVEIAQLKATIDDLKPGLGEIMGVVQQHHAKLFYSGRKANWPLADYELGEIQEGLDDLVKYYPTFKGVPVSQLVPSLTRVSLDKLHSAIQSRNEIAFLEAFNSLSTSCSNCHKAANHPFVQIQPPADGMFSNQKFTP